MKTDRDIEKLFEQARVPELPEGVRKRVFLAIGMGKPERVAPVVPLAVKWALAASFLLALALHLAGFQHERGLLEELTSSSEGRRARNTSDFLEDFGMEHRMAFLKISRITVQLRTRRVTIDSIMKGDSNGT